MTVARETLKRKKRRHKQVSVLSMDSGFKEPEVISCQALKKFGKV